MMNLFRKVGRILGITIILALALTGMGYFLYGLLGYGTGNNNVGDVIDMLLGGSLIALSLTLNQIPRWNQQQAAFRLEAEERRRAAMRRGFQEWARARGLTTTEADAIQVVDAQQTQLANMWKH
jgi:hypothetical protein